LGIKMNQMDQMEKIAFRDNDSIRIDADGIFFQDLNRILKETVSKYQPKKVILSNVCGQRYIGTNLKKDTKIEIYGTPGNDLGAFMDGPIIEVFGNAQDGCGNTMNDGEIIIHGNAGDIVGFSARGGEIFIEGDVGYRVGIHMKEYEGKKPVLVIGGTAQDFLGEYMAGGVLISLGLSLGESSIRRANFIGTGMHGGVIYLRGTVEDRQLGKEVSQLEVDESDMDMIEQYVRKFVSYFGHDAEKILSGKFVKLLPLSHRPYGNLYAY